jgi:GPH family glycoside/pentoside/hexuronide:cation symporter
LGAAAWREAAGLFGVIIASLLPSMILAQETDVLSNYLAYYSLGFALVLALAVWLLLAYAPPASRQTQALHNESPVAWQGINHEIRSTWHSTQRMMSHTAFNRLLWPYFLNAIAMAIPSILGLFFINDRLQAPQLAGAFFAVYFVAAALGLPCWVKLAKRIGVLKAWRLGMLLAMTTFAGAVTLGSGDIQPYFIVCFLSGLALGADLALPPIVLAQTIEGEANMASYFGLWTLLGKLALALSGLALPCLAALNYQPGMAADASLAWIYAGLPCLFKCIAFVLLNRLPQSH